MIKRALLAGIILMVGWYVLSAQLVLVRRWAATTFWWMLP